MTPAAADGHGRWLEVEGARLWVCAAGAGAPLVLVHGWAMDHRIFRLQVSAFARHFRVVAYDRRGFGRSEGTPDLGREVEDLDCVARFADKPFGEPFHLLGLSQGGRIALRYAAARPERLRSLILQGAPVGAEDRAGPADERIPLEEYAALVKAGRVDEVRRRWLAHPMMRLGEGHPEAGRLLHDMVGDYTGADLVHGSWGARAPEPDVLDCLAGAGLPVLILTGARETAARRRSAGRLLETLPRARELVLEQSGHLSNLTEPDAYNAAVIEFCRQVDGRRRGSGGGAHD